jgi:N-terminal half of MaoC dehydratase
MTYISTDMQRMVGTELRHKVAAPISASDVRRWAIAVYHPNVPPRLFWDHDYAIKTSHRGIVAPEDFNPFAWAINEAGPESQPAGYDPDWIEKSLGIQPPPLKRFLHGGMEVEYGVRMHPGDVIQATSSLAGYEEKQGKMGALLFTTVKNTWRNQEGALVKHHWHHGIRY